jgi:dihydrodipicolinate synthase/N-acetylneuraminate lyase
MGLIKEGIRLPLVNLNEEYRQIILEAMKEANIQI